MTISSLVKGKTPLQRPFVLFIVGLLIILTGVACTSSRTQQPYTPPYEERKPEPAPPPLNITAPTDKSTVNTANVTVVGNTIAGASLRLNGTDVGINADGTFSLPVTLKEGYNLITISARSSEGGLELKQVSITYTLPPPPPPPPEPPKTYNAPATSYPYTASVNKEPFHYSSCYWAQQIHDENRQWFSSRDEAIAAGHRPCKVCNP